MLEGIERIAVKILPLKNCNMHASLLYYGKCHDHDLISNSSTEPYLL